MYSNLTHLFLNLENKVSSSLQLSHMSITSPISETSSVVSYQLMSIQDIKNCREWILCTFAGLMNTGLQQRWRLCSKRRLQKRYAIIILKFMPRCINGLILVLIHLVVLVRSGILRWFNRYSIMLIKTVRYKNCRWLNVFVRIVKCFWLIVL